ncbi:MAG: DNA mismatch repair endonuclease MutL [Pirellulales bacterium]
MPHIERLQASVINQIAAGEVIERPASVVKELLENSIDAGATRVEIAVAKGGTELVRIADDGCGITADQLTLAVDTHATSKLRTAEDLEHVGTLGFRGEALASIAEVSRFTLRSRPADESSGAELSVRGGQRHGPVPCGCPVGTTIEVADLFFNTPVRRRFLRSTQTEMGHIVEAVTRLALANPHVHFTLRHNDRIVHDLPPADPWSTRVAQLFGGDILDSLVWVDSSDDDVRLSGYVGLPEVTRSNAKMQYLLLNGRYIRDRSLQHALGEAYRGLILTGRYAVACLRLDMPAEQVDVNVHPTKLKSASATAGRIYSQVLATLRTRFLSTDLTHRLTVSAERRARPTRTPPRRPDLVNPAKRVRPNGGPMRAAAVTDAARRSARVVSAGSELASRRRPVANSAARRNRCRRHVMPKSTLRQRPSGGARRRRRRGASGGDRRRRRKPVGALCRSTTVT